LQRSRFCNIRAIAAVDRGKELVAKRQLSVSSAEELETASPLVTGQDWLAELVAGTRLTPKGRQLVHLIERSPRLAAFGSASELAANAGVNAATVVRFAQALGFQGWPEFQLHFRHRYLGTLLPSDVMRDRRRADESPFEAALHQDIENLEVFLASGDFGAAETVAHLVAESRRTLVVSSGSYAAPGLVFTHLAKFMGYDVSIETRGGAHVVAELARLGPGDCLIAISFWRLNKQVVLTTRSARARGVATVAVTDSLFSPLAQAAEHALVVPTESASFFQSLTAATSLVYGLLARLYTLGGERVRQTILDTQELYGELDVLYG
jgi:DNA-binding MurR/RpiR family transcriptional regulator